jgi:hypothetical protein
MAKITKHSGPSYTQDELFDRDENYPRTVVAVPSGTEELEGSDGVSVGNSLEASQENTPNGNDSLTPSLHQPAPMMASHSKPTHTGDLDAPSTDGDIQRMQAQPSGKRRTAQSKSRSQ